MDPSASLSPIAEVVLFLLGGACVLAVAPALAIRSGRSRDKAAVTAAALHPLVCLALFYSLALHMYRKLDGWPEALGTRGFPDALVTHADAAGMAFGSLLLATLFALPAGAVACALVPRLRAGLRSLGVYAVSSALALALMSLAPEPFLYWWWD